MTTTEDNKDQGALEALACTVGARWYARHILSALSEAGYTVVKTQWEWPPIVAGRERLPGQVRRQVYLGPWELVPESDTLGGGANG